MINGHKMKKQFIFGVAILFLLSGCTQQPAEGGGGEMPTISGKNVLLIIAPSNFRDEELFDTKAELEKAGAATVIASRQTGTITGMLGGKANATLSLSSVKASDFDAVVFIGGSGASAYFNDSTAQKIAKDAAAQGKVLAAICIAPSILANAGLLQGKNATAFSSESGNLQSKGANYTGSAVTVDGKIITANGPAAAKQFGKEIVKALAG
jgi:protease I